MAWTFINDSLCTTICLQWDPEIIAIALFFLAGKLSRFEVVDWEGRLLHHKRWWDTFVDDLTLELLEDICHQVLDLYSFPIPDTPQDSPPSSPVPSPSTATVNNSILMPKQSSIKVQQSFGNEKSSTNPEQVMARTAPPPLPPPPPPPPPLPLQAQLLGSAINSMTDGPSNLIPITTSPRFSVVSAIPTIGSSTALIAPTGNTRLASAIPSITSIPPAPAPFLPPTAPAGGPYMNLVNPLTGQYPVPQPTPSPLLVSPVKPHLSVPGTTWEFTTHQSYVNYRFALPEHKSADHKK